jgi:hypothetical protein
VVSASLTNNLSQKSPNTGKNLSEAQVSSSKKTYPAPAYAGHKTMSNEKIAVSLSFCTASSPLAADSRLKSFIAHSSLIYEGTVIEMIRPQLPASPFWFS